MPRPLLLIIYAAVAVLVAIAAFKYVLPILLPFIIALIIIKQDYCSPGQKETWDVKRDNTLYFCCVYR